MRFVRSLQQNKLGPEGAKHLAEGLAKNEALTSLKYAASCTRSTVMSP